MRLIVTGGCGFVGFNVALYFASQGHRVTCVDNLARRGSETNVPELRKTGIRFLHGDIRNPEDLLELPGNADALIECSAQPSVVSGYTNPVYDFRINVEGVINCLEFCRRTSTAMIFLSSSRVYPANKINSLPMVEKESRWDWDSGAPIEELPQGFDPVKGISAKFSMDGASKTIYGASKAAADFFCQEYADAFGFPVIVNRFGVIAGEGQFGVVNQGWLTFWAISCLLERSITYFGHKGKQVRDVLFIGDVCEALRIELGRLKDLSGRVWNLGGGRDNSLSLVEATAMMERLTGKRMQVSYQEQVRKADVVIYITDNSDASHDLEWAPSVSLEDGTEKIVRWVADNRDRLVGAGL